MEIAKKLIQIYQRTGRIVVDAYVEGNFIVIRSGKVICIDIGFAFNLTPKKEGSSMLKRSPSYTSLAVFNNHSDVIYRALQRTVKTTVSTQIILALLLFQRMSISNTQLGLLSSEPKLRKRYAAIQLKTHHLSEGEVLTLLDKKNLPHNKQPSIKNCSGF